MIIWGRSFKNLLLKNHWARKAEIYMEASSYRGDSSLLKSWPPGVRWGHNRGSKFCIWLYRKNLLKIFFSRTTGQGKLRFTWKLPDIEEIQVCSNHDPWGYDGATIRDQSFTYDYIGKIFKNLLLKNHWARKAEIYMEASWYSGDSSLFKSWPLGVQWGSSRGSKFYIWLHREILLRSSSLNQTSRCLPESFLIWTRFKFF